MRVIIRLGKYHFSPPSFRWANLKGATVGLNTELVTKVIILYFDKDGLAVSKVAVPFP